MGHRKAVKFPFQGTVATTDSERMWAVRYYSEHNSRSLFFTTDVPTLRKLYPDLQILEGISEDAWLVASEPLGKLAGVWNEVPQSSCGVVGPGEDHLAPFDVKPPATSVTVGG